MSFDAFLYQRCTITRRKKSGQGRYNQTALSEVVVGSDTPCRMTEKRVRLLDEKSGEYAWVLATLLIFQAGTDVQTNDEISIEGETGAWVAKQRVDRRAINTIHHISMVVEALNG